MDTFSLSQEDINQFSSAIDARLPELEPYEQEVDEEFLVDILSPEELEDLREQAQQEILGAVSQYRVGAALVTLSHMIERDGSYDVHQVECLKTTRLANGAYEVVRDTFSTGTEGSTHSKRLNPAHPSLTAFEELTALSQQAVRAAELEHALGADIFYPSDLPGVLEILEQCTPENRLTEPRD